MLSATCPWADDGAASMSDRVRAIRRELGHRNLTLAELWTIRMWADAVCGVESLSGAMPAGDGDPVALRDAAEIIFTALAGDEQAAQTVRLQWDEVAHDVLTEMLAQQRWMRLWMNVM